MMRIASLTFRKMGILAVTLMGILFYLQFKILFLEGEVISHKERLVFSTEVFSRIFKNRDLKNGMFSVQGGPHYSTGSAYYDGVKTKYYLYSIDPHSESSVIIYEVNNSTYAVNLYPPTNIYKRGTREELMLSKAGEPIRVDDKELLYLRDGLEKDNTYMIVDYRHIDRINKWHGLIDIPRAFSGNK